MISPPVSLPVWGISICEYIEDTFMLHETQASESHSLDYVMNVPEKYVDVLIFTNLDKTFS